MNPALIHIFAPVFASMWVGLSSRNANPSIPLKFAFGLIGLSAGFFVIAWGAANAGPDNLASPAWLVVILMPFFGLIVIGTSIVPPGRNDPPVVSISISAVGRRNQERIRSRTWAPPRVMSMLRPLMAVHLRAC